MPLIIPIPADIFHPLTHPDTDASSLSLNMAAADSFLGVMDCLWFHQIILFTGSTTSQLIPKLAKHQLVITKEESLTSCPSPSSSITLSTLTDEEISAIASPLPEDDHQISPPVSPPTSLLDESSNEEDNNDVIQQKERPTRSSFVTSGARSHPSSPSSTQKRSKNMRRSSSLLRNLPKYMSCKTLKELELEEVKGFMDLGFVFKKESLSPRMMSVIPGLQRLEVLYGNKHNTTNHDKGSEFVAENDKLIREEEEEKKERGVIRPYLSEAWLIKRPDSPLLNLRVPRVYAATDMKKHLKLWATTVASVTQQES